MNFDYEIPIEEYAAAQVLIYRAHGKGRMVKQSLVWVLLGLLFLIVAVTRWVDWGPLLLWLIGAWFVYCGIASLFPARSYRRIYPDSGLAGNSYHAELDAAGFSVTGNSCNWRVLWTDVALKREDKCVFIFHAKATLFIFGKKYLTAEQQKDIRQFAAMPMA